MEFPDHNLGDRKLKTVQEARDIFNRMWRKGKERRQKLAMITRQLNGGKPFSDAKLQELGQGWRTNHNFRDASSMLEQVLIAYWRMLHDVTNLIEVTVHNDQDPDNDSWERIFKQNFDRFVRDWGPDYVLQYLLFSFNHVSFGVGPILWPDPDSPRWQALRMENVMVPEKAKATTDNLELAVIKQEMSVDELWQLIRTDETKENARAAGWNVGSIRRVLTRHIKNNSDGHIDTDDEVDAENKLRNSSVGIDNDEGDISVFHVFVKEYDGKINHRVFAQEYETDDYLFDDYSIGNRPEKMGEALTSIFFEVGNGYFYGIKGFGHKNFGTSLILNRLKSRAVDATVADGLNFKDMSEQSREIIPITNVGPFNFLPRDIEQIPSYPSGNKTLETIIMFDQNLSETNARYRDQQRSVENTDTATQANILASLQSQVDVANATLYLTQFGQNVFEQQLRRLRKRGSDDPDAKEFRKRCLRDGMSEEIFYEAEVEVRTGADPGTASATFRAQILAQLMGAAATNPILEARPITEGYIVNTLGASAVRKYTTPAEATEDVSAIQKAQGENGDFGDGLPVPVWQKDNHEVHVPVHLQPLAQMIEQFKATGQPNQEHMLILQMSLPHVEQHMEYLKQNPLKKEAYQKFQGLYAQISAATEGMFAMVQKMQAQQQQGTETALGAGREGDPDQAMSRGAQ
jgi:hypothetical protein